MNEKLIESLRIYLNESIAGSYKEVQSENIEVNRSKSLESIKRWITATTKYSTTQQIRRDVEEIIRNFE